MTSGAKRTQAWYKLRSVDIGDAKSSYTTSKYCSGVGIAWKPAIRDSTSLPLESSISDAYPNPFNPSTEIRYNLTEGTDVRILIHDVTGRLILSSNFTKSAGYHTFRWSGSDMNHNEVANGVYVATILMNGGTLKKTQRITLLK